jgi:hypothetical protein
VQAVVGVLAGSMVAIVVPSRVREDQVPKRTVRKHDPTRGAKARGCYLLLTGGRAAGQLLLNVAVGRVSAVVAVVAGIAMTGTTRTRLGF